MKIAYVTSNRPTEYHHKFKQLLGKFGEVTHLQDEFRSIPDYDVVFVESIDGPLLECLKYNPRKLIVRTTGIEIYEGHLKRIQWPKVWKLIAYSHHQIDYFKKTWTSCRPLGFGVIPPVMLGQFKLKKKTNGKNIGVIANITGRKNLQEIPLFLKKHPDYAVHHLGVICAYGAPVKDYIDTTLKRFNLTRNYFYQKHIKYNEINSWLNNMDYIWLPSIQEGFNRSILEGMGKGLTPIIKNYPGATSLWPRKYIYDELDEINLDIDEPEKVRGFIEEKYSEEKTLELIKKELKI